MNNFQNQYLKFHPSRGGTIRMATQALASINDRIAGLTASDTTMKLFTTRGSNVNPWVRNASVWTNSGVPLDLTGCAAWNETGATQDPVAPYAYGGATAISPRHVLLAEHIHVADGDDVVWVTNDNTIVVRTLTSTLVSSASDARIGVLNADLPSTIAYYPVVSQTLLSHYLLRTDVEFVYPVTIICLDQEGKVLIDDIQVDWANDSYSVQAVDPPIGSARLAFHETIVPGDSGNPVFLVLGNRLVLFGHVYSDDFYRMLGYDRGPGDQLRDVNNIMIAQGGGYEITRFGFGQYRQLYSDFVSDPPTIIHPSTGSTRFDTDFDFTGGDSIHFTDVDPYLGIDQLPVILEVGIDAPDGVFTLGGTTGLTFVEGANGDSAFTFRGLLSAVNTAMVNSTYTPIGAEGDITITINACDTDYFGAGGAQRSSAQIVITVDEEGNDFFARDYFNSQMFDPAFWG